jgi:exodeoxyribonuclease VII small subunit
MATQPGTGLPLDTDLPAADAPRAGDTPADDASAAAVADLPFDAALAQLAEVVGRLESGGLPLETSIALYERGVALHARCARLLDDAELRVQRLVEEAGGALRAIDLSPDDADDDPSASA